MKRYGYFVVLIFTLTGCLSEESRIEKSMVNNIPRFTGIINDTALNNAITNIETTQIQGIYYADLRSNNELAKFLPEHSNNMSLQNTTNPNKRIYYFRNITSSQFNELYRTFNIEADDVGGYFNANLIDSGTYDPYIEYKITGDSYKEVRTVTIAGPYFTEIYTYSFSSDYNPGSSIFKERIFPRFNIEKAILSEKYGNPDISMFFSG